MLYASAAFVLKISDDGSSAHSIARSFAGTILTALSVLLLAIVGYLTSRNIWLAKLQVCPALAPPPLPSPLCLLQHSEWGPLQTLNTSDGPACVGWSSCSIFGAVYFVRLCGWVHASGPRHSLPR